MNNSLKPQSIMILGTSSGVGKSLISAAICRVLLRRGEKVLPFKGQNMSNNAWVDESGGEMAYSQALQAFAAGLLPQCEMNPVLLKPKGNSLSEVIHLGKSVGTSNAKNYYEQWFNPGWLAIKKGIRDLKQKYNSGRFIVEGAGSPVEVNIQHRDLTNLRIAKYLNANCLLVADIEKGGVFAQIIGTLSLLDNQERKLIKGILINKFRGDRDLFDNGRDWIEKTTGISVLGVMPWLDEDFPPEDTLDLIQKKKSKKNPEIEIAIIKLPSISNFSDIDPLEYEDSVNIKWINLGESLGDPDAVIIPGSKQTIKDLLKLKSSELFIEIQNFAHKGGFTFGICGGMQIMGKSLEDPLGLENSDSKVKEKYFKGMDLIPIRTIFNKQKSLVQREVKMNWPIATTVKGFELHHGESFPINGEEEKLLSISNSEGLGWVCKKNEDYRIAGTYLHGVFDNGYWRRNWLNKIRQSKGLNNLKIIQTHHSDSVNNSLNILANSFEKYVDITPLLKD